MQKLYLNITNGEESRYRSSYYYQFCCIISKEYLIKALALYYSLEKRAINFHIWFCVMDINTYQLLLKMNLKNVTLINIEDIEKDTELLEIKKDRSIREYCWTLKPALIEYVMDNYNIEKLLYCDSDIYFFSEPKYIYKEWDTYSCFMCSQRGTKSLEYIHGEYQAGLLGFKNDKYGRKILEWWKRKCFDWCYDSFDSENERWGDQRYLNQIPDLFENIKINNNIGINAAPWNVVMNSKHYDVDYDRYNIFINNYKLCMYHFGSIDIFNEYEYDLWKLRPLDFSKEIIKYIYKPYFIDIKKAIRNIKKYDKNYANEYIKKNISAKNYINLKEV